MKFFNYFTALKLDNKSAKDNKWWHLLKEIFFRFYMENDDLPKLSHLCSRIKTKNNNKLGSISLAISCAKQNAEENSNPTRCLGFID